MAVKKRKKTKQVKKTRKPDDTTAAQKNEQIRQIKTADTIAGRGAAGRYTFK